MNENHDTIWFGLVVIAAVLSYSAGYAHRASKRFIRKINRRIY